MVSYKQLYEELKSTMYPVNETDYLCPICNKPILEQNCEYYCSGEDCKFDKTPDEIWYYYAENKRLMRVD
jgi:hypothetical protein